MKWSRVCLVAFFSLAIAQTASANALDPSIIVRSGHGSASIFNLPFGFNSPTGTNTGGNAFVFLNKVPVNVVFNSLQFTVQGPAHLSAFTCSTGLNVFFTNCSIRLSNGGFCSGAGTCMVNGPAGVIAFYNFFGGHGIHFNSDFDVDVAGFDPKTHFTLNANVPEPATLSLVLLGAGAVFARRRRRALPSNG